MLSAGCAVRLCASLQVFGNESLTYATSPRMSYSLDPSELAVSSSVWSSTTIMDGSRLTPVLGGFEIFTALRNLRVVGNKPSKGSASSEAAAALQQWMHNASLSGGQLGVGLPVGAAAYSSAGGIHAFGLLYLARLSKQEL